MMKKRTFTILLVLVAFIASIYSPMKVLPIKLPISSPSSPYNTAWNGTSEFYNALLYEGYEVYVIESLDQLNKYIQGNDKVLFIVIAPDKPYTIDDLETIRHTLERVDKFSFLIADENITSNNLLENFFGLAITGILVVDEKSHFGRLYPQIVCRLNGTTYKLLLNIASYIAILEEYWGPWVPSKGLLKILGSLRDKPIVVYVAFENYEGIVISDSSIFINQFFNKEYLKESLRGIILREIHAFTYFHPTLSGEEVSKLEDEVIERLVKREINNREFALAVVKFLTHGDKSYKVIIDASHYKEVNLSTILNVPIPPIGLLLAMLLTMGLKAVDAAYMALIENLPFIIKIIALVLVIFLAYTVLKRLGGRIGFDESIHKHIEANVLIEVELPGRRIYDVKKLSKKDAIELLSSLYTILRKIALKELNIDISEAEKGDVQKRLRAILKDKTEKALKTIMKLRKIHELHIGKRKFIWPPILFWKRTLSKLILNSEMILEAMGATITGKPGVKGVEYRLRKI